MTIQELVHMAERIHDVEGWDLGAGSTRAQRNAFWMRVVGCAHFGHPRFNAQPDPSWHVKDAGGGRPQSDDVAVALPSREAWDCIPNAGSGNYDPENQNGGYRFEAHAIGVLPAEQNVYKPLRPDGSTPTPLPPLIQLPPGARAYPGDVIGEAIGAALFADYQSAQEFPNAGMMIWAWRVAWDCANPPYLTAAASVLKHQVEWRAALGLKP